MPASMFAAARCCARFRLSKELTGLVTRNLSQAFLGIAVCNQLFNVVRAATSGFSPASWATNCCHFGSLTSCGIVACVCGAACAIMLFRGSISFVAEVSRWCLGASRHVSSTSEKMCRSSSARCYPAVMLLMLVGLLHTEVVVIGIQLVLLVKLAVAARVVVLLTKNFDSWT